MGCASEDQGGRVRFGAIVGAHGLRGELQVKLHNPASSLLGSLTHVTLQQAGQPDRRVALSSVRSRGKGHWLVTIEGCDDRDAAASLRGAELCVTRAELPQLAEGEHYLVDLIGLEARLPNGSVLGRVDDAIEYPAAHVLRVRTPDGTLEVPLRAPYVVEIRLADGFVIVDELEELELQPAPARRS